MSYCMLWVGGRVEEGGFLLVVHLFVWVGGTYRRWRAFFRMFSSMGRSETRQSGRWVGGWVGTVPSLAGFLKDVLFDGTLGN